MSCSHADVIRASRSLSSSIDATAAALAATACTSTHRRGSSSASHSLASCRASSVTPHTRLPYVATFGDAHARDKALYTSWLADAYLAAGEVEQAGAVDRLAATTVFTRRYRAGLNGTMRTVIFDLSSVLIGWRPALVYEKLVPDPELRAWFLAEVCRAPWDSRPVREDAFAEGLRRLAERSPGDAERIAEHL